MFKLDRKLSKKIVNSSANYQVAQIKVNGINYFIKPDNQLKEILGFYLAKLLGLNCIKYESIEINKKRYSVSRDINELYEFVLASNIFKDNFKLNELINNVLYTEFYSKEIIADLIKMYLFDILFLNDDRHNGNWGIVYKNNKYQLIIFDNGNLFNFLRPPVINYGKYTFLDIINDFENFWDDIALEDKVIVRDFIIKANPNNVKKIFNEIEGIYNTKVDPLFINLYEERFIKIIEIMKNRGVTYGR